MGDPQPTPPVDPVTQFLMSLGRGDAIHELTKSLEGTKETVKGMIKVGDQISELTRAVKETNETLKLLVERLR